MSIFGKFEKKVESAVNGVFARAFKGDVQPVEIAARLQKELDAEAKLMSRDKRLVPNEFRIGLSEHDYAKLTPYSKTLIAELAGELKSHAREMGYVFNGPIRIHFEEQSSLPTGRFTVESEAVAGSTAGRVSSPRPGHPPASAAEQARPAVRSLAPPRHPGPARPHARQAQPPPHSPGSPGPRPSPPGLPIPADQRKAPQTARLAMASRSSSWCSRSMACGIHSTRPAS